MFWRCHSSDSFENDDLLLELSLETAINLIDCSSGAAMLNLIKSCC